MEEITGKKPIGKYSGLESLSRDFNNGYLRAILDITEIFKYVNHDFKSRKKRWNEKLIMELLNCILKNHNEIRDFHSEYNFVRWNVKTEQFEFYMRGR